MYNEKIIPIVIIIISTVAILFIYIFIQRHSLLNKSITTGKIESVILKQRDTDLDGLSDFEELERGLDSNNSDTDGDGLFDWYEIYRFGTDPLLFDTNGNGISDAEEVAEKYRTI